VSIVTSEEALIGCCIIDAAVLEQCIHLECTQEWFSEDALCRLFEALHDLFSEGKGADIISVSERCRKKWGTDSPNGLRYLTIAEKCVDTAVTVAHWKQYFDEVRESYRLRQYTKYLKMGIEKVETERDVSVDDLISFTEGLINGLSMAENERSLVELGEDTLQKKLDPSRPNLLHWPLLDLDWACDPIDKDYIILQADPKAGKTALAIQTCIHLGGQGIKTSYANLEMPDEKFIGRVISHMGQLNWRIIQKQRVSINGGKEEAKIVIEKAKQAVKLLKDFPLSVVHRAMTMEQLLAWGMKEKRSGSRLLVIDNTRHILKSAFENSSRVEFYGKISAFGKHLRDKTALPVILLHHTNREGDSSWSIDFHKDCDKIIKLSKEDEGHEDFPQSKWIHANCIFNRDGPEGHTRLLFDMPKQTFRQESDIELDKKRVDNSE
jgi:replicative DNA helicase